MLAVPGAASAHNPPTPPGDVDILNYALTLERLEATFYGRVLATFNQGQFDNANIFDGLGDYLRRNGYENFQRISEHEDTHVKTLVAVIREAGASPCPRASTTSA